MSVLARCAAAEIRLRKMTLRGFAAIMLFVGLAMSAAPAAAQSPNFTSYDASPSTTGGVGSRIVFTIGFNSGNRVASSLTITSALPGVTYVCSSYSEELNQQISCSGVYYTTASDVANGRVVERPQARLLSYGSITNRTGSTITATVLPTIPAPVASSFVAPPAPNNPGPGGTITFSLADRSTYDPTSYAVSGSANGGSVSVDGSGTVTYTPPVGFRGNDTFTYTATNAGGTSSPATVTVPVANPTLSATLVGSGQQGVALSGVAILPSGGQAPYSCAPTPTSGSLPGGVSINSDCTLSGTPTNNGAFSFSVAVTDSSTGDGPFTQSTGPLTLSIAEPPSVTIGINDVTVSEADGVAVFTVSLSQSSALSTTVNFATADGTAVSTGGGPGTPDYTATSGVLTFAPGVTTQTISVPITNDTVNEPTEQFAVNLSGATNASISDAQGIATITDDDGVPGLSINDVSQNEGDAGTTAFTFTVTLAAPSAQTVTVNYATANGSAIAGTDYSAASGAVTFAPGVTSQTVTVLVNGDTLFETDETFFVNLSGATNAVIGDNQGVGTIVNDDAPPTLSINDVSVTEGNSGTTTMTFTVTRTGATETSVSVDYATADGTATTPSDYTAVSGTLTFLPSTAATLTQTVNVSINGDVNFEADETLFVNLSNAVGATISDGQGTGTIVNDDLQLDIITTSLPNATVGQAYSQAVQAGGGNAPYTFAITGGALPAGLTMANTGQVTGTPTAGGSFTITVTATDNVGATDSQAITLVVNAPTIVLSPTSVPNPTVGVAYSQQLMASGGTAGYSYAVTGGSLPTGLTLSPSGLISGTPTAGGSFNFLVTATDSSTGTGPYTGSQGYTVTMGAPTITLSPAAGALPGPQTAQAYSQAFTATGGTPGYTYAVTAGSLPAGLTLSSGGVLSGTPTAGGTFNFTVTVTDSSTGTGAPYSASNAYSLAVAASTITVNPATLPNGSRGTAYSQTVSATGGVGAYTFAVTAGALPTGLTLNGTTGVISGTPTALATYTFTITATDSATGAGPYSGSRGYSVTIAALTLTVNPATLPGATFGVAYNQSFTTTGGQGTYTYAVTAGALPAGLTLSTGGLLSGTPTVAGTFNFTVTSTDSFGNTGTRAVALAVTARPDPSLDPDVRGLASAQAEATRRFASSQVDNFTRRLEQLHRPGAGNAMNLSLNGSAFTPLDQDQVLRPEMGRIMGGGLMERDAFGRSDADVSVTNRMAAEQSGQSGTGPMGAGGAGQPGRIRVWAGGAISLGERDATTQRANLDIRTTGISVGADASVSETLDIGAGIGFGQEDTDVGNDGSRMEGETWVGVGYLSWRPSGDWFVDAIAGYGQLSFDLRRRTPVDQSMVFGQRDGSMVFGSVSTGVDRTVGDVRWSGYGRLEVSNADLDAYTETGSPIWALSFEARDVQSTQAALGFRYERDMRSSVTTTWTPGVRFELSHELGDAGSQSIRYADLLTGPVYAIDQDGWDRTQAMVGISLRMRNTNGWTLNGEADTRFGGDEVMTTVRLVAGRRF